MSSFSHRLFRTVSLLSAVGALSAVLSAQTPPPADPNGGNGNGRQRRNQNGDPNANGGRGNFDPAQAQERMLGLLREQFAVTDDAEWTLISARVVTVSEIRRSAGGGRGGFGGGGPGGPGGGNNNGGGNRGNRTTGNPDVDALRQAIADNLPDAEIKSRLARVRDTRKENEAKLAKAQEDLRAVLTVRQEAIAVMFGLLP